MRLVKTVILFVCFLVPSQKYDVIGENVFPGLMIWPKALDSKSATRMMFLLCT